MGICVYFSGIQTYIYMEFGQFLIFEVSNFQNSSEIPPNYSKTIPRHPPKHPGPTATFSMFSIF